MSHQKHFPQDEENSSNANEAKKEEPDYICPEFVLIDERDGKGQQTYFGIDAVPKSSEFFQSNQQTSHHSKNGQTSLRFLCVLGLIFCLVFGIGMAFISTVMTMLATLSLFQNRHLNQGVWTFWKNTMHAGIAGFGFLLGLVSPTLGLGLIALYFSIATDLVGDDILRKFIRQAVNKI